MLALLLLAQVVSSDSARARAMARARPDSARVAATARDAVLPRYESAALRALVERASLENRAVPPSLQSYRVNLESETALLLRRAGGGEAASQLEQTASRARWLRTGDYEQRVVGYRAQQIGLNISTLSFWRQAWTVPVLYGNRIALLFGRDSARARRRTAQRVFAVHPLAEDRDRLYEFTGGDTVITLKFQGRTIPIVRVNVEPRDSLRERWVGFQGELDLDARRGHLVRMRGTFVRVGGSDSWRRGSRVATLVAFVEFVNKEIDGQYWLPAYQRIEAQAAVPFLGDERSVMRVVTRFLDYDVNDTTVVVALDSAGAAADTLQARPHRLVVASAAQLDRFSDWQAPLGEITGGTHSDDFVDVGPDVWRTAGPPRVELRAERTAELLHFSRVEGIYTGLGASVRFRNALPNARAYASLGWAWSEKTARGRLGVERRLGRTTWGARAGRTLDVTNDFTSPLDSGPSIFSILSNRDDYDYVDRYAGAVTLARSYGATQRGRVLRLELAGVADRYRGRTVERAPVFRGDSALRENRGVLDGDYARLVLAADYHPEVTGEFLQTGVGALLRYEGGAGGLDYHRVDARLTARRNWRRVTLASRLDLGAVGAGAGNVLPPQQLFELGENQNLPGYGYKEFGGDRAAVLRGIAMYNVPLFRAPIRAGSVYLPSPAPAVYASVQSGWADASNRAARRALRALGTRPLDPLADPLPGLRPEPVSVPTDGIRSSVEGGLRFFGGALGVGVARPVDRSGAWKWRVTFAQEL